MDFIDIVRRVQNMRQYGLERDEIVAKLTSEGIEADMVFFAWVASGMD